MILKFDLETDVGNMESFGVEEQHGVMGHSVMLPCDHAEQRRGLAPGLPSLQPQHRLTAQTGCSLGNKHCKLPNFNPFPKLWGEGND